MYGCIEIMGEIHDNLVESEGCFEQLQNGRKSHS